MFKLAPSGSDCTVAPEVFPHFTNELRRLMLDRLGLPQSHVGGIRIPGYRWLHGVAWTAINNITVPMEKS